MWRTGNERDSWTLSLTAWKKILLKEVQKNRANDIKGGPRRKPKRSTAGDFVLAGTWKTSVLQNQRYRG